MVLSRGPLPVLSNVTSSDLMVRGVLGSELVDSLRASGGGDALQSNQFWPMGNGQQWKKVRTLFCRFGSRRLCLLVVAGTLHIILPLFDNQLCFLRHCSVLVRPQFSQYFANIGFLFHIILHESRDIQ